jgi:hypothetical protein
LGGVPIGSMKAQLAARVAGITKESGLVGLFAGMSHLLLKLLMASLV